MSAANFRMRLFAPAQNGAQWRIFLEVFFWFFPKIIIFSRFSPSVSQVRGQQPHKSGDNPLPCQIKAVILHRNSKSPHAHRTFIALSPHTRARVAAKRRSSSAKARSNSSMRFARSRWLQKKNFVKFWEILFLIMNKIPKIIQDYSLF